MRRSDICLYLGPADRAELQALLSNRNTPSKLAWRSGIVLATAEGQGTVEIKRQTGMSKPTVWRWQERYLEEGVPGLKRDKTRPSRVPPLPREVRLKVIARTVQETPPSKARKLVMPRGAAYHGGVQTPSILCRERDMPHVRDYHRHVA